VKERVCPEEPFGLGLRLSAQAAGELARDAPALRDELARAGMYVFTINGFPYGRFHGIRVKEEVYRPDWSTSERLDYTLTLAQILADLLPEGVAGSISTVPVGYGKDLPPGAVEHLLEASTRLVDLGSRSGRELWLALEPEPDCLLETADEVVAFFGHLREENGGVIPGRLGICLDTCHHAVNFERPTDALATLERAGVPVPKIQLSAALRVPAAALARELLEPFAEPVYLHQTRVRTSTGVLRYPDLRPALEAFTPGEWRTHFHVPLNARYAGGLATTSDLLNETFLTDAATPGRHLEIETYTFARMPGPRRDVVDAVAGEFEWLLDLTI
jgi:hypothetical protein